IRVRLVFPNQQHSLRAGMSCTVRVHNQEPAPVILIPGKAIVEQMGEYFVFIAKDTVLPVAADSTKKEKKTEKAEKDTIPGPVLYAFQKKVITGQTIGPNIIIKDGIVEGDSIVVDGVQLLHDGSKITLSVKKPAKEGEPENGKGKKEKGEVAGENKTRAHKKD
ncbi:MAG: mexA 2, partial [Bacteroidota bacterium]|nr:mexA 2 [Bacteroidota bacterium]